MNNRALLVSAATGLTGFVLLQIYMHRFEEKVSGGPPISVVMAARDIPPGAVVKRDMLGIRDLPASYVEERHIPASDVEQVIGANATEAVKANESLLWTDLAVLQAGARRLSDLVQEGMRAITIRNRAGVFGGLLRPGDRVDLLFTEGAKFGETDARATSTLLQNLLVLAVGSNLGGSGESDRPEGVTTGRVTLGVTAEQGQLITQAEHQGQLRLVLRNPDDIVLLKDIPETAAGDVTGIPNRSRWSRRRPVAGSTREIEHVR